MDRCGKGLVHASRRLIDRSCRASVGAPICFNIHAPVIAVLCPRRLRRSLQQILSSRQGTGWGFRTRVWCQDRV